MTKIKIVCSKCGGENVLRDAYASWDVEAQEWLLSSVYDAFRCDDCGHDACDEVPADDAPDLLEVLKAVRGTFNVEYGQGRKVVAVGYSGDGLRPLIQMIDNAIDKAEGRA